MLLLMPIEFPILKRNLELLYKETEPGKNHFFDSDANFVLDIGFNFDKGCSFQPDASLKADVQGYNILIFLCR